MATLSRLSDVVLRIEGVRAESAAKIALDIDRRLVNRTPRDTGRAARNWIVSVGVPDTTQLPPPASPAEASIAVSEAGAILKNAKIGKIIYVQNNLPYIDALNNGHSPKAPPGFIEAEINAVIGRYR